MYNEAEYNYEDINFYVDSSDFKINRIKEKEISEKEANLLNNMK